MKILLDIFSVSKIKNQATILITLLKKIFFLYKLNYLEEEGNLTKFTKFKLIPKSSINLPFKMGRTSRGVAYKNINSFDPFGEMILKQVSGLSHDQLIEGWHKHLAKEKNSNAADIMNCQNNQILKILPAWTCVLPWEEYSAIDKFNSYLLNFFKNRISNGAKFNKPFSELNENDIYSIHIGKSHVLQTEKLIKSIQKNGIIKTINLPRVIILIRGKQWRWSMSTNGNHRSYIYYGLGEKYLYAIIHKIIYKKDSKKWLNVVNKNYTKSEAEEIFDNIFDGKLKTKSII